jgi:Ca-activated chloride channel family protein
MHIQTDRAFVPAGSTATRYLSVTLSAPSRPAPPAGGPVRPGVDVSLVLDRSGSMAGRKIELARQAVAHAIRLLHTDDQLNVVVFDDRIDTILERMPASTAARNQALAALARVDARGSTDLSEGWFTGARALSGAGPDGRVRRVLLLTDGQANRGVVEPDELAAAAARFRAAGIGTSTFGLGDDFDEELLTRIAAEGGGHSYFIEQPVQIPDFFASELGEVLDVVARSVTFEIVVGRGVRVTVLNPLPAEQDGGITRVRLGDFVAEQEVTLLVAVEVEARAAGEVASLQCRVSDRDGVLPALPMQVDWSAVTAEQDRQQAVNRGVLIEVARMMAESARLLALSENRKGGFGEARRALGSAAEQIRRLGDDEALHSVADLLAHEQTAFSRTLSARDMKSRRYAAYAAAYSRDPGGSARKKKS